MLLGKHVRKRGDGSVTGFCKAEDPVTRECIVEVMHAPGSVREDRVSASQLEVVRLLPNMRAWAFLEDRWWPGRLGKADSDGTHEWIGSDKALYVRPAGLRVRPEAVEFDPRTILKGWAQEGMYLFRARDAMMREVLEQESYAHGMTGLLSSGVDLYQHQIQNVFRVLMDPVQRYMLGDEVGLGKTIQAGILIRQWMLDEQAVVGEGEVRRRVLVAVPEMIVQQWAEELRTRFRLDDFRLSDADPCWRVVSHDRLADMLLQQGEDAWPWTDLVLDEVQQVTSWVGSDGALRDAFEALRVKSKKSQGVLLLSATPPYGDHDACLALLQLLDPYVYDSIDREELRQRLALRQKVSAALPFLRLGQSAAMVRLKLKGLDEAIGSNLPDLKAVLERARDAAAVGQGTDDLAPALEQLRIYLREVVRIHNRFIRSRRDQIAEFLEYRGAEETQEPGYEALPDLAELGLADDVMEVAADCLEVWRASRSAQVEGDSEAEARSAWVHEALWVAMSAGECVLREVLAIWGTEGGANPHLESFLGAEAVRVLMADRPTSYEEEAIQGLHRFAAGDGLLQAKMSTLVSWISRNITKARGEPKHRRVVVFASGPGVAGAVRAHIANSTLGGFEMFSLRVDEPRGERRLITRRFRDAEKVAILICDSAGEEGVNLQFADVLVHMDLPLCANRVEQRIGRLDRIGQTSQIHQRIVMAAGDEAPDACRAALLDQAYGVFTRSISGLQAAVEDQARELRLHAFRSGHLSLAHVAKDSRERVDIERARVSFEQDAEVASADESGAHLRVNEMQADETRGKQVASALDDWVVGCYKLRKTVDPVLGGATYSMPKHGGDGLLDPGQQRQVRRFLDEGGTFLRQEAAACPKDLRLRRLGDGLFDAFARMARFEDRGKCFAVWRHVKEWHADEEWSGFRFDVLVRVPASVTNIIEDEDSGECGGAGASQGVLRRMRSYLPTFRESIWVRRDGVVESRVKVISTLDRIATDSLACPVEDTNLHKGRWKYALKDHIDLTQWHSIVDRCADVALAEVALHPDFKESCARAADAFERDSRRREAVLDLRVRLMGGAPDGLLARDLERERATRESLAACLRSPEVRLDAAGFMLASGQPCP